MSTTTSLLQTALQNLHVSQQMRDQSHTPRAPSSAGDPSSRGSPVDSGEEDDDDEIMVKVGKGTAPGTPVPGQRGLQLGQRLSNLGGTRSKDPVSRAVLTGLTRREMFQLMNS